MPNRLIDEKSPYLLQHAYNPVDWYAWGEEAFSKAHEADKPIFLSVGYSTCHWCHVMEHESFEDPEVAQQMNEAFVNVKVDREERPDVDDLFMAVCQLLTGSGGWPLTIIMTPDKQPFFAGTYLPRDSRFGRSGMLDLIPRIREVWQNRRDEVLRSAGQIFTQLQPPIDHRDSTTKLDGKTLHTAYEELARSFDERHGGFGDAPKFPMAHNLLFLLRYWKWTGQSHALLMAERTLDAMQRGGIYDHLGFGFHRYSTDERWLVPHFEKMLYDQAMLILAYTEAFQATGKPDYERTAREILNYVLRDLTDAQGGFYCAEDADSEGVEGKFYLWQESEIRQLLSSEEAAFFMRIYNVEVSGNFTDPFTGMSQRENVLHRGSSADDLARAFDLSPEAFQIRLQTICEKLFRRRAQRRPPQKDDKILTDWNGLMIAALAKAGSAFDEPAFVQAGQRAAEFILKNLLSPAQRLLHRYRDGEAALSGYLDDYAFFTWGLIELYQATFQGRYLEAALNLTRSVLTHFGDERNGGFNFTADDGEALPLRRQEIYDGAVPSGNSVMLSNLLRLARLTGDVHLEEKADQLQRTFAPAVSRYPAGYAQFLLGILFATGPAYEVVIVGNERAAETQAMVNALRQRYLPNLVVHLKSISDGDPDLGRLASFTQTMTSPQERTTAYVCQNHSCQLPVTNVAELLNLLKP